MKYKYSRAEIAKELTTKVFADNDFELRRIVKDLLAKAEHECMPDEPCVKCGKYPIPEKCDCSCHEFGDVVHSGVCECGVKPLSFVDVLKKKRDEKKIWKLDYDYDWTSQIEDLTYKVNELVDAVNKLKTR